MEAEVAYNDGRQLGSYPNAGLFSSSCPEISENVCQIIIKTKDSQVAHFATGFIVGGSCLLTNYHVLSDSRDIEEASVTLQLGKNRVALELDPTRVNVWSPDPPNREKINTHQLDYRLIGLKYHDAIAALHKISLERWSEEEVKPIEKLTIHGYPQTKNIDSQDRQDSQGKLSEPINLNESAIWYAVPTSGGSSGSVVVSSHKVIALHQGGGIWGGELSNRGILINSIIADLEFQLKGARGLLSALLPPPEPFWKSLTTPTTIKMMGVGLVGAAVGYGFAKIHSQENGASAKKCSQTENEESSGNETESKKNVI